MKKLQTASLLAIGLFAFLGGTSSLKAQILTNVLTNGNFDAAGQGPTTGFNAAIGWQDAFPGNTASGVFNNNPVQSAPNAAFVAGGNNGGFQLTSQVLALGDVITLTYYAANSYNAQGQNVNLIAASSQGATFAASSILATGPAGFTAGGYNLYTVTYIASAADAGKYLGVEFDGLNSGNGGYTNYDTFVLTDAVVPAAVPEPSTWALMLGGLGLFALLRRFRQFGQV